MAEMFSAKLRLAEYWRRYRGMPPTMPYTQAASRGSTPGKNSRASKKSNGLSSICAVRRPYSGLLPSRSCSFMNDKDEPQRMRKSLELSLFRSIADCKIEGKAG